MHCQFWDFESSNQNVIISRKTRTSSSDLTLNNLITAREAEVEERLYLAVRQLNDGTYVYFLSLTDITREDEGNYTCKVQDASSYKVEREQAVYVSVRHFPSTGPSCSIDSKSDSLGGDGNIFNAGDKIILNCTSEQTSPPLNLQWSRSGHTFHSTHHSSDRSTTSALLHVTLGMIDNSKIFVCQVSSPYFPGVTHSCHVGPFNIIPNSDHKTDIIGSSLYEYPNTESIDYNSNNPVDCLKKCSTTSSATQHYWIMSTAVSGVLALTLCIVAIILVFRYYRLMTGKRQLDLATRHAAIDDIYEKVQCREDGGMVYMSLKKTMKPGNSVMYVQRGNHPSTPHYNMTPSNEPLTYPSQYA